MTPCGIYNFCPRGSSSPTPCPAVLAVDAVLGPANGPAYDVDTGAYTTAAAAAQGRPALASLPYLLNPG